MHQVTVLDAGQQPERQRRQERFFFAGRDHVFARRLHEATGHFGNEFVGRQRPDRIEAEIRADLPTQTPGHVDRRSEKAGRARGVHKKVSVVIAGLDQRRIGQGLFQ